MFEKMKEKARLKQEEKQQKIIEEKNRLLSLSEKRIACRNYFKVRTNWK